VAVLLRKSHPVMKGKSSSSIASSRKKPDLAVVSCSRKA
jgi:hypothetical protein